MPQNIFVNYRRQTDSGIAGRIYDSLRHALPGISIFMDVDKLSPGEDFEIGLQKNLDTCKVFLAIIGPQWGTIADYSGHRRLDKADDFVRKELGAALAKNLRVIPVLIGDAQMPDADTLPPDLKPLARRQAMEIRHERFTADVDALAQAIAAITPGARHSRWPVKAMVAAAALALIAAGVVLYLRPPGTAESSHQPGSVDTVESSHQPADKSSGPAWTSWMSQEDYQAEFDRQLKRKWYPSMIEAQLHDGIVEYRAFYVQFPPSQTFGFYARHSISDAEFNDFDKRMAKEQYMRMFQQRIVVDERAFNQGVWTKP